MVQAAVFHSIACCHARFKVPFSWLQAKNVEACTESSNSIHCYYLLRKKYITESRLRKSNIPVNWCINASHSKIPKLPGTI